MIKIGKSLFCFCLFIIYSNFCFSQSVSSIDLVKNATNYDGQLIIYEGEVIGILKRDSYSWVNVLDKNTAIGVWAHNSLLSNITYVGQYGVKGDRILVTGIFNKNCPDHGGDLDIHAISIKILEKGKLLNLTLEPKKVKIVLILFTILITEIVVILVIKFLTTRNYGRVN